MVSSWRLRSCADPVRHAAPASAANQRRAASLRPAVANRSCDSRASASSGASAARHSGADGLSRRSRAISALDRLRSGEIGLGQHQPVGDRDLLGASRAGAPSWASAVYRIDRGDDVAQPEMVPQHRVGLHRREDGERVGQAGALDDQPPEARHLPALALRMQVPDRRRQLAADGAAQAARLQQHHGVVDALQQMMVEPDLAEFVDQHRGIGERRIGRAGAAAAWSCPSPGSP